MLGCLSSMSGLWVQPPALPEIRSVLRTHYISDSFYAALGGTQFCGHDGDREIEGFFFFFNASGAAMLLAL